MKKTVKFFLLMGLAIGLFVIPAKMGIQWSVIANPLSVIPNGCEESLSRSLVFLQSIGQRSFAMLRMTAEPASAMTVSKTPANTLTSGLVGWWTFDQKEVTVNTTTDKSGNGNDGKRVAGTSVTVGKIGQAMKFDGSTGIVSASAGVSGNAPYTISAWTKVNAFNNNFRIMVELGANDTNADWCAYIGLQNDNTLGGGHCGNNKSTGVTPVLGRWYQLVQTYDGTYTKIFVDGVQKFSSNTMTPAISAVNVNIGLLGTAGYGFAGSLDDVRIYNRALSLSEIQQLYKMGGGKISKTPSPTVDPLKVGLTGWWTFDQKKVSGSSVLDSSGNNYTGTAGSLNKAVAGKIGQAMNFVSSSNSIIDTGVKFLDLFTTSTGPVVTGTISLWMKYTGPYPVPVRGDSYANAFYAQKHIVMGFGAGTSGIALGSINGVNAMWFYSSNGASYPYVSTTYAYNKWTHLVWMSAGDKLYAYVNGVLIGSVTQGPNGAGGNLHFGSNYFNDNSFVGQIDDVRTYNRVLSASEVQQLYKMGGGKISKTPAPPVDPLKNGLVGWWTLDQKDVTANTTTDKSGNGNDGTRKNVTKAISGKIGQGISFGLNGYFDISSASLSFPTNEATLVMWIKLDKATPVDTTKAGFVYLDNSGNQSHYPWSDGKAYLSTFRVTRVESITLDSGIDRTKWHLIAITTKPGTNGWKFFQNGKLIIQRDGEDTVSVASTKTIGKSQGEYYIAGSLDDVRIYNRALSAQEIQQLYRMGK